MSKTNEAQKVREKKSKVNFAETVTTEVAEILSLGEMKARDRQNALVAGLLMEAVREFLTESPERSELPYAKIPEITGGLIYEAVDQNVGELMIMAFLRWSPRSEILKLQDTQLKKDSMTLDVIFENLRVYESRLQKITPEEIKKPRCLALYDSFKNCALIPDIQNIAILLATVMIENGRTSPLTFKGEEIEYLPFDSNRLLVYKAIIPSAIPDIMNFSPDVLRSIIAETNS